jgi:Cu2+-containing amine oxidase
VYDLFAADEPFTSFDAFIDGDSIEDEDLVAWVTLAKEHLPRNEDIPLIRNMGTYFDLVP